MDGESTGSTVASPPDDPLNGNPYAPRARQAQPDLDSGVPLLTSTDMRRMNRRALGLLASIALLLVVIATWALGHLGGDRQKPKIREETITVPDAPNTRVQPPLPAPISQRSSRPTPIDLAPPSMTPRRTENYAGEVEQPRGPTLVERRIAAAGQGTTGVAPGIANAPMNPMQGYLMPNANGDTPIGAPPMSSNGNLAYTAAVLPEVSSAAPLTRPDTLMLRGTYIRCVLETRIITDIPGFTSCVVTEPVYSFTGKRLLLPKGSKVMGKYDMEPDGPRVAVIWDRIVTPNGIDVNMASPGIDNLGGSGHPGHYSAHWGNRIGGALLISLMSDAFKYEAAKHGPRNTTISNGTVTETPFESNTAATVQQIANQAVKRAANRPATVSINQGTILAIYVAKDVDFAGVVTRY
jgi:type IV secretion system protein VirB10